MKNIPVDLIQVKTSLGLQIKVFRSGDDKPRVRNEPSDDAHRDDHYIFFLLTNGSGTLEVERQQIELTAGHLYYILPTQVHTKIKTQQAEGWFVGIDVSLVAPELRDVFENRGAVQLPYKFTDPEFTQYSNLLDLLVFQASGNQDSIFHKNIVHGLAQSFLAMAANSYLAVYNFENNHSRAIEIVRQFRQQLSEHIHQIKSPAAYAEKLNVSPGYLNETVKKVTGSTVTYWIQQEVFNEAKRILYHTDTDIKQIAYQLGFSDHSYFIRSFRKSAGLSPAKFRKLNQK